MKLARTLAVSRFLIQTGRLPVVLLTLLVLTLLVCRFLSRVLFQEPLQRLCASIGAMTHDALHDVAMREAHAVVDTVYVLDDRIQMVFLLDAVGREKGSRARIVDR